MMIVAYENAGNSIRRRSGAGPKREAQPTIEQANAIRKAEARQDRHMALALSERRGNWNMIDREELRRKLVNVVRQEESPEVGFL